MLLFGISHWISLSKASIHKDVNKKLMNSMLHKYFIFLSLLGPQLIMSFYGLDIFGHDVIRGYGVCHIPLQTGEHKKRCARKYKLFVTTVESFCRVFVYVPQSSSMLQQVMAWLTGRRPELIDTSILASGNGRECELNTEWITNCRIY